MQLFLGVVLACVCGTVNATDYRVTVKTDRSVYAAGDVLRLAVDLLNDGNDVFRLIPGPRPDTPALSDQDAEAVFPALLGESAVDALIQPPSLPDVIGFVQLIPVRPSEPNAPAPKIVGLPLFGHNIVGPHSTRIISIAQLFLKPIPVIEPNHPEPNGLPASREMVEVAGSYPILHAGDYVVDCRIFGIADSRAAQAQQIVHIVPRMIPSRAEQLMEQNNKMLRQANGELKAIKAIETSTNLWVRMNNALLKLIVQYVQRPPVTTSITR